MNNKLISVNDKLYYIKGTQSVESVDKKGGNYWKKCWGVDAVLRNGDTYFFCQTVIDAEFLDI